MTAAEIAVGLEDDCPGGPGHVGDGDGFARLDCRLCLTAALQAYGDARLEEAARALDGRTPNAVAAWLGEKIRALKEVKP